MSDRPPREDELREIAERFGLRVVPRPERWFASRQGRIRAAAWTALAALFVLVCPASLLLLVSETAGVALAILAAAVLFLAFVAIWLDALVLTTPGTEEDENERAVARMVSGKGVRPPR